MADETKRVIDQTTDTSLSAGDFVIVDSQSEGTRKFDLGTELTDIKQDLADHEDRIDALEQGGGSGMTTAFKQALHNILEKVAYIDEYGQTYLDALDDAMYPPVTAISLNTNSLSFASLNSTQQLTATTTPQGGAVTWTSSDTTKATVSSSGLVTAVGYGSCTITATSGSVSATCSVVVVQATVSSISAVYTQSGTVYNTDTLDSLKSDLVVTALWSNGTTSTVPSADYTLSGTLTAGTSTITVSYGGKTTTFNVTVTHAITDTTAEIEYEGYVLEHFSTGEPIRNSAMTNGGITIMYDLDESTTDLSLSGIIPFINTDTPLTLTKGAIAIYDSSNNYVNYVYERMSNGNRWAQPTSGTPTEYQQTWTVNEYSKIVFSVDMRCLDDAYMYHTHTGQVFFAGINTPYYGMSNISEAGE